MTRVLHVRVEDDTYERLLRIARETDRPLGRVARRALEKALGERPAVDDSRESVDVVEGCTCTLGSEGVRRGPKAAFGICSHGRKVFT